MNELEIGKAGEHLTAADLILRGFHTCLADQGSPFDLIVDVSGRLMKIQVKTTTGPIPQRSGKWHWPAYRFGLRRGRGSRNRSRAADVFAFVALDTKTVCYVAGEELDKSDGIIGLIEFAAPGDESRSAWLKRKMADYQTFPPVVRGPVVPSCHPNRKHYAKGYCQECYCQKRHQAKVTT